MDNEKIKILKMLEAGKISAEEAARLLESGTHSSATAENRRNDSGKTFESYTGDISRKAGEFAKDLEPKINRFADIIVEKTAQFADKISESIQTGAEASRAAKSKPGAGTAGEWRTIEAKVQQYGSSLELKGINGDVHVKGYNGDKISIKIKTKSNPFDAQISFSQFGSMYKLVYDENLFSYISIDAFIPYGMFENIKVSTEQAKISVSDISCRNVKIDDFNSSVTLNNVESENVSVSTSNGDIFYRISDYREFAACCVIAETNNGTIDFTVPPSDNCGYMVEAHTSLGSINIGLTNMQFLANDLSNVHAKSANYESAQKKINFKMETSNARIRIN